MKMTPSKVLLDELRATIWITLIRKPGLGVSEISRKLKKPQSTITEQIQILERNKYIKVDYKKGKRGIKKKCYPSMRGLVESYTKFKGNQIIESDYEAVDRFYLKGKFREILLKEMEETKKFAKQDPVMALSILLSSITSDFIELLVEEDTQLLKEWKVFQHTRKKVFG